MSHPKMIVGWREWISLPQLNIPAVKIKADTGARTSALHVFDVEEFEKDGTSFVRFNVHPVQHRDDVSIPCEAKIIDRRTVTNSGGTKEERLVIMTEVSIAHVSWEMELTLTNRDEMQFRMLLGRSAMSKHIVVDPSKSFTAGKMNCAALYGISEDTEKDEFTESKDIFEIDQTKTKEYKNEEEIGR